MTFIQKLFVIIIIKIDTEESQEFVMPYKLNGERTELNKIMFQSGNAVAYLKYSKKYLKD